MTTTASRALRKEIAEATLKAMENGYYILNNVKYPLPYSTKDTHFYNASELSKWPPAPSKKSSVTLQKPHISILEVSTIEAARLLSKPDSNATSSDGTTLTSKPTPKVGVLNFASAKNPGGGFLGGAQAQEESIARSSTLYQSLTSHAASQFYASHKKDPCGGYYSHAMIFSSNITVFRDDNGGWMVPFEISVVTSPAVNAGVVRKRSSVSAAQEEEKIERVMKERMARILFLFESNGVSELVLGSFGTGVFRNTVPVVARLWAELLGVPGSRFETSFKRVVFGILGRKTYDEFKQAFNETCNQRATSSIT